MIQIVGTWLTFEFVFDHFHFWLIEVRRFNLVSVREGALSRDLVSRRRVIEDLLSVLESVRRENLRVALQFRCRSLPRRRRWCPFLRVFFLGRSAEWSQGGRPQLKFRHWFDFCIRLFWQRVRASVDCSSKETSYNFGKLISPFRRNI